MRETFLKRLIEISATTSNPHTMFRANRALKRYNIISANYYDNTWLIWTSNTSMISGASLDELIKEIIEDLSNN